MSLCPAVRLDELWSGEMLGISIAGRRVLLVHLDHEVKAYEDRCVHFGVALSGGCLRDGVLTCPAHEWQYDARTGRGINPASVRLRSLPVQIRNGIVYVDPSPSSVAAGTREG